jgi:hypothetical protein
VTRVTWADRRGLRLLDVRYLERRSGDQFAAIGVLHGYPPNITDTGPNSVAAAWKRSEPLEGATLPEADGDEHYLNIAISFAGTQGSAGPLQISYVDSQARPGVVETKVTVSVRPHCS